MCSLSLAQRAPGAALSVAGQAACQTSLPAQPVTCHRALSVTSSCLSRSGARVTTHPFPVLPSLPSTDLWLAAARETEALTTGLFSVGVSHFYSSFPAGFPRFLYGVCGPQTVNELALVSKGGSTPQVMGLCSCTVPSAPWLSCPGSPACSLPPKDKPRSQIFSCE